MRVRRVVRVAPFTETTPAGRTSRKSPFAKLKDALGTKFHYSNAGVAHLVLLFHHASGQDLYPFLKNGTRLRSRRVSQGYSGIYTTPREYARFMWLALHKGEWAGKRLVPAGYYDFAWKGQEIKPDYAGLWWVYPRHKDAPKDLVQTAGAFNNDGYVVPSKDLISVRLGDGKKFPKDFADRLVMKVLAAVNKE